MQFHRNVVGLARLVTVGAALLLGGVELRANVADGEREVAASHDEAWALVATLQFTEASQEFRAAVEADPTSREARLGAALMTLQAQPRTVANIERALGELDALRGEESVDRVALMAGFLAARVVQRHREPADAVDAARRFRALAEAFPEEALGQMAWVRWALLVLFNDQVGEGEIGARLAAIEREGARLTAPLARRDFHLLLSMAYPQLAPADEAMLRHLRAAEATGLLRWSTTRDVYVRIVETALVLGQVAVAEEFFARFEAEYARDERTQLMRERVAAARMREGKR